MGRGSKFMTKPKYTRVYKDRHGKWRWQFRRKGFSTVELPGPPGTPGFEEKYAAALRGDRVVLTPSTTSTRQGTIASLCAAYISSPEFQDRSGQTRRHQMVFIERLRTKHGTKSVAKMQRKHASAILSDGEIASTAQQRNRFLSLFRKLMNLAIIMEWRSDDPTAMLKAPTPKTDGFPSWTDDEIDAYRSRHPKGSKARLAMMLALCTGQRRSDVVRMGWQHIKNGKLTIRQQKTGMTVSIPVLPELMAELEHLPRDQLTFLLTEHGKSFAVAGFGNWFRKRCNEAGLKGLAMHGLRMAKGRQLAEAGATASEITAILGHKTVAESEPYVRAANRARLAESGMMRLTQ